MTKRIVLLQALASTPVDLTRLVHSADNQALHWQNSTNDWSAAAVLIHFAQVEKAYRHRLQRIASEDEPHVPYIHPEVGAIPADVAAVDLLHEFEKERAQTIAFLTELSPAGWQRPAIHETIGRTTMRYMIQNLVDHDIEHTNQLVGVLQQMRKEIERLRD